MISCPHSFCFSLEFSWISSLGSDSARKYWHYLVMFAKLRIIWPYVAVVSTFTSVAVWKCSNCCFFILYLHVSLETMTFHLLTLYFKYKHDSFLLYLLLLSLFLNIFGSGSLLIWQKQDFSKKHIFHWFLVKLIPQGRIVPSLLNVTR
jgi:hypothetical protein